VLAVAAVDVEFIIMKMRIVMRITKSLYKRSVCKDDTSQEIIEHMSPPPMPMRSNTKGLGIVSRKMPDKWKQCKALFTRMMLLNRVQDDVMFA
jgi:hypothetical protein